jgi:hypothetical protein
MDIDELVKDEIRFCEEEECVKNDRGAYFYKSGDGVHMFNLPHFLKMYREWLVNEGLVNENSNL